MTYHKACINRSGIVVNNDLVNGKLLNLKRTAIEYIIEDNPSNDYARVSVAWHQWLIVSQINRFNKTILSEALGNSIIRAIYNMKVYSQTATELYNILKNIILSKMYRYQLAPTEYNKLKDLLIVGESKYTMSKSTYLPMIMYRFNAADTTTIIPDVTILQSSFNGNALEFWDSKVFPDYKNISENTLGYWERFMCGFNMSTVNSRGITLIIGLLTPVSNTYGNALFSFCKNLIGPKPDYYIEILELHNGSLKAKFVDMMNLFVRISNLQLSDGELDKTLSHMFKSDNSVTQSIVIDSIDLSEEGWLPSEKELIKKMILSLEADGEDDAPEDEDTGDESVDDENSDADTSEDDESSDDDTETDDDTDPDSDDSDNDTSDDDSNDDDSDDDDDESEEDNTPNISDIKGVMIEIADKETLDSAMFRLELSNKIKAKLEDKTLNNIQILILKKLKTYWLNYWSIQSILDTLELVNKMG